MWGELNISLGTDDIPHGTQGIPYSSQENSHGTEHPHSTQDIPPRYWTHIVRGTNGQDAFHRRSYQDMLISNYT